MKKMTRDKVLELTGKTAGEFMIQDIWSIS